MAPKTSAARPSIRDCQAPQLFPALNHAAVVFRTEQRSNQAREKTATGFGKPTYSERSRNRRLACHPRPTFSGFSPQPLQTRASHSPGYMLALRCTDQDREIAM